MSSGSQHASKTTSPLAQWSSLEGNAVNVANGGEDLIELDEGKFSRKETGRRSKRNKNKYHGKQLTKYLCMVAEYSHLKNICNQNLLALLGIEPGTFSMTSDYLTNRLTVLLCCTFV